MDKEGFRARVEQLAATSPPVRWVNWWKNMDEGPEKAEVTEILFVEGRLRNLAEPNIKQQLVQASRTNAELMAVMLVDVCSRGDD